MKIAADGIGIAQEERKEYQRGEVADSYVAKIEGGGRHQARKGNATQEERQEIREGRTEIAE